MQWTGLKNGKHRSSWGTNSFNGIPSSLLQVAEALCYTSSHYLSQTVQGSANLPETDLNGLEFDRTFDSDRYLNNMEASYAIRWGEKVEVGVLLWVLESA